MHEFSFPFFFGDEGGIKNVYNVEKAHKKFDKLSSPILGDLNNIIVLMYIVKKCIMILNALS